MVNESRMKYVITVTELTADPAGNTIATAELFRQAVAVIDLPKIFAAVNARPRKPRTPKASK